MDSRIRLILVDNAKKYRYFSVVFILPPWEGIYRQDTIRVASFAEACQIHEVIRKTYQKLEYQLVGLPSISIPERVVFILEYLTQLNYEFIKKKVF
ncbi:AAA family ATPase [Sunxiuqinia sp. sy24]|uniref:AAA family ATPase n=1 Tax=Sunxiuqinia sp. sy24 TaxID=3461495 RepID=UPI004045315C